MPYHTRRTRRPGLWLVSILVLGAVLAVWQEVASISNNALAAQVGTTTARSLTQDPIKTAQTFATGTGALKSQTEQLASELLNAVNFSLPSRYGNSKAALDGTLDQNDEPIQLVMQNSLNSDSEDSLLETKYDFLDNTKDNTLNNSQVASQSGASSLPQPPGSPKRSQSNLAVISAYNDDLDWLLESPGNNTPIVPTEIYQIADLGFNCEPVFPRLPLLLNPDKISAAPAWPEWAQDFIDEKCAMKDEAEPLSVFDVERRARLEAGLPWGNFGRKLVNARKRKLLDAGRNGASSKKESILGAQWSNPASKGTSSIVTVPAISPLPLHIIPAMGRESMAYLTAIIDHYDDLPDLMLFMHGHERAWHTFAFGQRWGLQRLRALPPRNLSMGYMHLGCIHREESFLFTRVIDANHISENGPRWKESMAGHFLQFWTEHLGEAFGMPLPPKYLKAPCCATFAVTKEAIQRRPKSFYEGLRGWLLRTPQDKYWAGVAIEFSWHMAFTGLEVYDPSVDECRKELYDI